LSPAGLERLRDWPLEPPLELDPPPLVRPPEPDFFAAATGDGPGPLAFFSAATGESRFSLPPAAMGDAPPEIGSLPAPLPERPALTFRFRGVVFAREPLDLGAGPACRLLRRAVFAAATGEILRSLPSAAIGDAPPARTSLVVPSPELVDLPASTFRLRGLSEAPFELRDLLLAAPFEPRDF
jgi:hypothetical protein